MYYVYIIYSDHLGVYYKGFTMNPDERLKCHLEGGSEFTSRVSDWRLVYSKVFKTNKKASHIERLFYFILFCFKRLFGMNNAYSDSNRIDFLLV